MSVESFSPSLPDGLHLGDRGICKASERCDYLRHDNKRVEAGEDFRFMVARHADDPDVGTPWVRLYDVENKLVADCNPMYFGEHFDWTIG